MRQAILCSADTALEGLETTFPDHNGGSDGWDAVRFLFYFLSPLFFSFLQVPPQRVKSTLELTFNK